MIDSRVATTADPKTFVVPLGKPIPPTPEEDWNSGSISVDIGELVKFQHSAVKMERTEDGTKLIGKLSID